MERCSVERAAVTALAVFLQGQFDADARFGEQGRESHVVVRDEWPAPGDNLPPRCVTILCAGERRDDHLTAEVDRVTVLPNSQGEFTWRVKAFTQPLQLDIWATYDSHRNQIQDALDRFLNMGELYTLGSGDITRDGPLLQLDEASGHYGFVDFTFEGPRPIDTEDANGVFQYRTLIRGEVSGELTFTAKTARLVRVLLQQQLNGSPANFTLQNTAGNGFGITSADI